MDWPEILPADGGNNEESTQAEFVRDLFMDLLETIFASGFDTVLLLDDERRFTVANEPASALFGATREEILARRFDDFLPPARHGHLHRTWARLRKEGALDGRYELQRGDGLRVAVEFRARWSIAPGRHLLILREVMRPRPLSESGATTLLTPREREILQHVSGGRSNREIAGALFLSPATVKIHLERIYAKLDVTNRAQAVATALRDGLIG